MKFSISKKQKIILVAFILLLIFVIFYIFIINKNINKKINNKQSEVFVPTFLEDKEKNRLNIRSENKIQVLKRNAEGKIILYKIIREEGDIVTSLEQIVPISSSVDK